MDVKGFETFVQEKNNRFYRYAFFLLRDKEEARDVLQEAYADVWKMRNRLSEYRSLEALVLRIIRNKCFDQFRFTHRSRNLHKELLKQAKEVRQETPETILEAENSQLIIDQIICSLSEDQREIIFLKNVEDMTCEQIASLINVKVNTVEVILSRVRKQIRSKFELIQRYESRRDG